MSIRPVKRIVQSKPTIEGAGVKLRRAFGFGDTAETDPFLLLDDFRNEQPGRLSRRLPLASAPRHRDRHLYSGRHRRTSRQPRQPRHARLRRRAMDDRRARHHASGNAAGRRARPHARLPALGQSSVVAQDDGAALSGRQGRRDPGDHRRRRHARARGVRRLLGQKRSGRRRRRRSALSRRLRAAGQAQDLQGRGRAPRLRLCVRRRRPASPMPPSRSAC